MEKKQKAKKAPEEAGGEESAPEESEEEDSLKKVKSVQVMHNWFRQSWNKI
jgi:hypothetical protein